MNVRVNLNNYVHLQLTSRGRRVWHDAWAPYSRDGDGLDNQVSADGTLRVQLWQAMQIFGPYVGLGFDPVFEAVEITIEDAEPSP